MREPLSLVLEREIRVFTRYAHGFYTGTPKRDKHLELKYAHSLRVLRNARIIAGQENCFLRSPQADRALCLSALYHDLGRFEQLKRFNTFRDADSVNHGLLGCKILTDRVFLSEEAPVPRQWVRGAVLLHNRLALPPGLPEPLNIIVKALRDADKIDIIGVLQEEFRPGHLPDKTIVLELQDKPDEYSPEALDAVLAGCTVRYAHMGTLNDFRLLLCSWVFGLEFAASRRLLAAGSHMDGILHSLPRDTAMNQVRERVRTELAR